jgi:omega-6 fatty acid desaturase (delta-12 desaturase)
MSSTAVAPLRTSEPTRFDHEAYGRLKGALSFERNYLVMLGNHALDAVLLGAAYGLYPRGWLGYLTAELILAAVFFRAFCILHECGHGSASRQRWQNVLSGHLASIFCFLPFYPWKYIHEEHHRWSGHLDKDPTAKALATWKQSRKVPALVRFTWRTWIPLGALIQQFVFWFYPAKLWRQHGFRSPQSFRTTASVSFLGAVYAALLWWLPWAPLVKAFIPAFVIYLVINELVNIPHHVDRPFGFPERLRPWQQYQTSRSCYYPPFVSELFILNFNFHVEHHLFPALPWYRLRAARSLVKEALAEHYEETWGISWNLRRRREDLETVVLER